MAISPGSQIEVRFTKWGGGGHWEFPLTYLGNDDHGHWAAGDVGTILRRPEASFASAFPWVTLLPYDQPWAASFYDSALNNVSVYVDMTTVPLWSKGAVTLVDLDLDVVLGRDGSLFVDDEDEFALHQASLDYPDEIIALARTTAQDVLAAIANGHEPFHSVGQRWLGQLSP